MTVLSPTASIWAVATRITSLDAEGFPDPGNAMYVTEQLMKLTPNEVTETGDEPKIEERLGQPVGLRQARGYPGVGQTHTGARHPRPGPGGPAHRWHAAGLLGLGAG